MQAQVASGRLADGSVLAGRYRVESLIGRGGMAEVYRARDERLQRNVALKVLRASLAGDLDLRSRFEEEARAAAMVSHPNVVAVYDAGEDGSNAYIVMELVEGETLAEHISGGPLEETAVRRIGEEVLDALSAAHSRGVLHRDIKPANVLCAGDGTVKVADFGIAKAVHPSPDSGEPTRNVVLGTPSYLAPERAQGHPATVRSDLWSVGVMLYECLTGAKPFEGDNPIAVTLLAREGKYKPIADLRPKADPSLAGVIERALRPEPAERFTSAAEMARFLRNPNADPQMLISPLATALSEEPTQPIWDLRRTVALGSAAVAGATKAVRASRAISPRPLRRRINVPAALVAASVLVLVAALAGLAASGGQQPLKPVAHVQRTTNTTKPRLTSGRHTQATRAKHHHHHRAHASAGGPAPSQNGPAQNGGAGPAPNGGPGPAGPPAGSPAGPGHHHHDASGPGGDGVANL